MGRLTEWVGTDENRHAIPRTDIRKNGHQRCCNKLAHYEDLEEQGRLKKLGCAVGSNIYFLLINGEINSQFIDNIQTALYFSDDNGNLKKGFYRTEKEAEARLREIDTHERE